MEYAKVYLVNVGGEDCFAMIDKHVGTDVDATFISPQGILELTKGEAGTNFEEMAPYQAISMKSNVATSGYEDSGPLVIEIRRSAEWNIDCNSHLFRLASMHAREESGVIFGYMKDMYGME